MVKALLGNTDSDVIYLAINKSFQTILEAVLAVSDPDNAAIHSSIGVHIRGHPDWMRLAGEFWEGVALGPKLDADLLSVQRDGASSPEWLTACQSLAFGSRSSRNSRADQLEAEMVRAIAGLDAEILRSAANPDTTVPGQLWALDAAIEALAKLAALEDAIRHPCTELLQVRCNLEAHVRRARQVVWCSTAVRALSAAAANVCVETLTAASDSLRDPKHMGRVMTPKSMATVMAAIRKFMDAILELPFDSPANFQLGYLIVDIQELANILVATADDSAAAAKFNALFRSQRVALQTWEATVAVEQNAAMTIGGASLSAQRLPAARLAKCLAEWASLSNTATRDQSAPYCDASVTPEEAVPAACRASVFVRGSALLNTYYNNILTGALDNLQSATLALDNVARGGDDGASWKCELASNAMFPDVKEAAQVLLQNASNFAKPLAELKKASVFGNSRRELQVCQCANGHVQTSLHAAHENGTCCCHNFKLEALAAYLLVCAESSTEVNLQMTDLAEEAISQMRVAKAEAMMITKLSTIRSGDSLAHDLDSYLLRICKGNVNFGDIHSVILLKVFAAAGMRGRAAVASWAGPTEQQGLQPLRA